MAENCSTGCLMTVFTLCDHVHPFFSSSRNTSTSRGHVLKSYLSMSSNLVAICSLLSDENKSALIHSHRYGSSYTCEKYITIYPILLGAQGGHVHSSKSQSVTLGGGPVTTPRGCGGRFWDAENSATNVKKLAQMFVQRLRRQVILGFICQPPWGGGLGQTQSFTLPPLGRLASDQGGP